MVPLALVLSISSGEAATSCGVLGKSMTARFESLKGEVWCRDQSNVSLFLPSYSSGLLELHPGYLLLQ